MSNELVKRYLTFPLSLILSVAALATQAPPAKAAKKAPMAQAAPAAVAPASLPAPVSGEPEAAPTPSPKKHKAQAASKAEDAGEWSTIERTTDESAVVVQKPWIKEIVWDPDSIPSVNLGVNIVTTFLLPPTEAIISVQIGNEKLWGVTPVEGKNAIFVKPVYPNQKTNMVVITRAGRIYTFYLTANPSQAALHTLRVLPASMMGSQIVTTPGSSFAGGIGGADSAAPASSVSAALNDTRLTESQAQKMVTEAVRRTREAEQARANQEKQTFAEAMLSGRNDKYDVAYDRGAKKHFEVTHVFDVAGMTYIRVVVADGSAAAFHSVGADGNLAAVQFSRSTTDPNILIVDGVYEKGLVTVGDKRANIVNRGLGETLKRKLDGKAE